jgi:predicted GIY-YIG superfamily endonuclease
MAAPDMNQRLEEHNPGKSIYTNKYKPWKLGTYIAFSDKKLAHNFERYLKKVLATLFLKNIFFES